MKRFIEGLSIVLCLIGLFVLLLTTVPEPPVFRSDACTEVTQAIEEAVSENYDYYLDSIVPYEYQDIAYDLSKEYKIDFPLLVALMEIESRGNEKAISSTNDYGICQINKCNHKWLKEKVGYSDILNAEDNIRCCCYMLARYYKVYDLTSEVLLAYHLGGRRANELISQGIVETDYTRKILRREKEMIERKINE